MGFFPPFLESCDTEVVHDFDVSAVVFDTLKVLSCHLPC